MNMAGRKSKLLAYLMSAVMVFSVFAASATEVLAGEPGASYEFGYELENANDTEFPYIPEDLNEDSIPYTEEVYPLEEEEDEEQEDPDGEDITDAFTCQYFLAALRALPEVPTSGAIFTSHVEDLVALTLIGAFAPISNITSLDGIEYFTALGSLVITNTQITELDLRSNTSLNILLASYNRLESVHLPQSGNLELVNFSHNYLTDLDVRNALSDSGYVYLDVTNNDMTNLNDVMGWENYFDREGFDADLLGFAFWPQRDVAGPPPALDYVTVSVTGSTFAAGTGNNQSGEGLHRPGTTVTIRTGSSRPGEVFDGWRVVSGGVTLANANNPVTTFTMPDETVVVEATWIVDTTLPQFNVTITGSQLPAGTNENQSGAGSHRQGSTVTVRAGTRTGFTFNGWISTPTVNFYDVNSETTTFTMPASDVALVASWISDAGDFEVTVNGSELPPGSGSNQSGTGRYVPGATVTIRAGTRSGYVFSHWTIHVGGITLANSNSPTTTFTMPESYVSVSAIWERPTRRGVVLTRRDESDREASVGSLFSFPNRRPGYSAVTPLDVYIHNYENTSTGEMTVTLSGPDSGSFILRGGSGGSGNSDSRRNISSISPNSYRANAFSVAPRTGLSARSGPYTAFVTVSSVTGDRVSATFEVRFLVSEYAGVDTFTLTLRAGNGGEISLDGSTYGATRTGQFYYGQRIDISARSNRDFDFDRWRYNWGETQHEFRTETRFTMPNRDVTVWADFTRYGDRPWDWDRDRPWDWNWPHAPHAPHAPFPPAPTVPPGHVPPPPQAPPRPPAPPAPPPTWATPIPEPPANVPPAIIPLSINLNGNPATLSGQTAMISQGVALIPVAEVFSLLNFTAYWNEATQEVTLRRGNIVIVVTEGSRTFSVNGVNRSLPSPATIINGYMMVPFVEILESIGARTYRDANNVIQIFATR